MQDVLDRINNADGNFGSATPVTASLNISGNGIRLVDASVGGGTLSVTALNAPEVATPAGDQQVTDKCRRDRRAMTESPCNRKGFRDAHDAAGCVAEQRQRRHCACRSFWKQMVRVPSRLAAWWARTSRVISARKDQVVEEQTQLKQALSLLADTDFTEAATRFQQLQTAYQASLQVARNARILSLLDFLK